jgi:ATPases involved in chromosome partitioning
MSAKIIALCNQKGGCAKTTTVISLATGLARRGKRVLVVDFDPQANCTQGFGFNEPDELEFTMYDIMKSVIDGEELPYIHDCILKTEGIDLLPSSIELASIENLLINTMTRESKLKKFLTPLREDYDYILIDTMPSLGMLVINALVASDSVIIPVQAHYFSAKGVELLIKTVAKVRQDLNPNLAVDGILITMIQANTDLGKLISKAIRDTYEKRFNVYDSEIPYSIKAAETSAYGVSLFSFKPSNRAAQVYEEFITEVANGK